MIENVPRSARRLLIVPFLLLALDVRAARPPDIPTDGCSRAKVARFAAGGFSLAVAPLDLPPDPYALDTDVLHYQLDIEVKHSPAWLGGANTITVKVIKNALAVFRFRLHDALSISAITVDNVVATWQRLDSATIEVRLPAPYSAGSVFDLKVAYQGQPVALWGGSITFGAHAAGQPVVATLSEPWYAYSWWPLKDDNRDKANADFLITVAKPLVVVANGALVGTDPVDSARIRYHWRTGYATAPYLFCFSIANYTTFATTYAYDGGSMPVQFYIYPEDDTPANRSNWSQSVTMLDVFGKLFGLYPFLTEKYGIYEFPFSGGMEHQTITGQGGKGAFAESLSSHELSHQWWGNMITCATWHDVWLNEGFATYAEALWLENAPGSLGAPVLQNAMAVRQPTSVDGTVYVFDTSDPDRIFSGNYSYRKGAWVLHMLRHIVGDDRFFALLKTYRETFAYRSATTADFQSLAESEYGGSLAWFFDRWVYGTGAPGYRLGWQNVTAAGKRYLELHVEQTQTVAYPVFAMPLDVVATVGGRDIPFVAWNSAPSQHYLLPVATPADWVALDPYGWVLNLGIVPVAFTPGPAKIVATDPAPGVRVGAHGVFPITVTFHKDVVATASAFTVAGRASGAAACDFAYDAASHTVTLTPRSALPFDEYTLTITDAVRDVQTGLALDGEIKDPSSPTSLPSGDGIAGGAAVIRFSVARPPRAHLHAAS